MAELNRRAMLGLAAAAAAGSLAACSEASSAPAASQASKRRFENKVIVITGATSGIGRAAALAFAAEGGKVGFCGRRTDLGQEVEREIRSAGGEALYVKADVLVDDEVRAFIDRAASAYGRLDVAFNNAGITIKKPFHEYSAAEWTRVNTTNFRAASLA